MGLLGCLGENLQTFYTLIGKPREKRIRTVFLKKSQIISCLSLYAEKEGALGPYETKKNRFTEKSVKTALMMLKNSQFRDIL